MDVVVRQCREFAQQYPAKGNSILFTGGTGVGKTFLTNCIAKELIDRCISVIYLSSNELFEIFSKYKFGRESEEDAEESYRYILECDMLIPLFPPSFSIVSMSASAERRGRSFPRTCP